MAFYFKVLKGQMPLPVSDEENSEKSLPLGESELGVKQTQISSCFFMENTFPCIFPELIYKVSYSFGPSVKIKVVPKDSWFLPM